MCLDTVTYGLRDRHIYFAYNATSTDIVDNTVEQLGPEAYSRWNFASNLAVTVHNWAIADEHRCFFWMF